VLTQSVCSEAVASAMKAQLQEAAQQLSALRAALQAEEARKRTMESQFESVYVSAKTEVRLCTLGRWVHTASPARRPCVCSSPTRSSSAPCKVRGRRTHTGGKLTGSAQSATRRWRRARRQPPAWRASLAQRSATSRVRRGGGTGRPPGAHNGGCAEVRKDLSDREETISALRVEAEALTANLAAETEVRVALEGASVLMADAQRVRELTEALSTTTASLEAADAKAIELGTPRGEARAG
jgi:hypothetical protein